MPVQRLQIVLDAQDNASRKIKSVQGQMKGFGAQMKNVAGMMLPWLGLTAAIGGTIAAIKSTIKVTMDFEKAMTDIATLVDTSTESMEQMGAEVLEMSKRMPVSIDELTSALYQVRSAGINAADAMAVLESSGRLAVAGLGTVTEATDILTSSVNVFSVQGYSAYQMANILFKTVKYGKTTVRGLAQSFGQLASIAGTSGVKLTEMQAATATLTTTGLAASDAQTQLSSAITSIVFANDKMLKLYKKLGVENGKQLIQQKGLVGALKAVVEAVDGDEAAIKKLLRRKEALKAMLSLTGAQAEKFNEILADMELGFDDLTIAFEKQKETAHAQYQMFKNQLNVVMIQMGKETIPYLIQSLQYLLKALNYVTTGAKLSNLGFQKLYASAMYLKESIVGNQKEMNVWSDVINQIEQEAQDVMIQFDNMVQELDLMGEGLSMTTEETQAFQDAIEDAGDEAEKAFEKAVKGVKEIRDEIKDAYKEIEKEAKDYRKRMSGEEENFQDESVKMVVDAENKIKEYEDAMWEAAKRHDDEEVYNLEDKIEEQKAIIKSFKDWDLGLGKELAERRSYMEMNEMDRLRVDHEKRLLLMKKEYLEGEITRAKKLIALTKEHETAIDFIGREKEAAIQAEIEKEMSFREALEAKTEALKSWIEEQKLLYRGYAESIGGMFGGPTPTTRAPLRAYQFGTSYVPKTGAYTLHEGEAVIPAGGSAGAIYNFNFAGAFIGDKIAFEREIIDLINRQSELKTLAGE
ncbi:MAG: phage tail tape measure protein [Candidatus Heimdallarchaeaceae archaeon]